jgi:xanthine dehydrogenase accessory factor
MREVLKDLELWRAEGEKVALATLVGVRGSAPRSSGARMAMTAGGRMTGSVSGGCVENDVMDRALRVLESGRPELVSYDIVSDDDLLDVGLHCGSIDVLIEPYNPDAAWALASESVNRVRSVVMVTALSSDSADTNDALVGRRISVVDGQTAGAISPEFDEAVKAEAGRRLSGGRTGRVSIESGGVSIDAFVEVLEPRPRLFIVGATHIAVPLCEMASHIGFHVTIVDPRKLFACESRFPGADELCLSWPDEAFAGEVLDSDSYVVAVSHDSKFDVPALAAAMRAGVRYIGALGSRATHARRIEKLREAGFGDADFERIHAPIGLDIGAVGADEIAVAIVAELLAVRRGRDAESGARGSGDAS